MVNLQRPSLWFLRVVFSMLLFLTSSESGGGNTLTRIVQTRYGKLQGIVKPMNPSKHLKPIEAFLGVPYATPPVASNRFSPTRTPSPWEGVLVADKMSPVCPQQFPDVSNETAALLRMPVGRLRYLRRLLPELRNQSEDCLYLNIYAPAQDVAGGRITRHPVLLYIHGESYSWNSGNPYDGSVLASYADIVVVTLNYRLGILGFLNANAAPHLKARVANYGLMDQVAALHWVQQNIAVFGGDPGSVTLMGHGTGAACIHLLIMSPTVMPGLFHRAVLLSGSALSSWAIVEDPVHSAMRLARQVNCTVPEDLFRDHEEIVDCLRDVPLQDLIRNDVPAPAYLSSFGPSVDGVVIKTDFREDLLTHFLPDMQGLNSNVKRSGESMGANRYDLLFGVVTSEALWRFSSTDIQGGFDFERRDKILRTYVRNAYVYHLSEIFLTVVNEYTDWERTVVHPINTRDATVGALSDAQFVAPVVQTGDLLSTPVTLETSPQANTKSYFYVFDYQTKDGDYPQRLGTVHGDELTYFLGAPLVEGFSHFLKNYTKSEVALCESVITYLANFVRTGNPNDLQKQEMTLPISKERNRFRSIVWDEYDPVHQKYLEIGLKPRMKNHFRAHQLSVWLRLIPELHRAGMEDAAARHNLFRNHGDASLYDGPVRPDPLSRTDDFRRRQNPAVNGTVAEVVLPITTMETMVTTCVSVIGNQGYVNPHVSNSTDTLASLEAAGYAAYSTALSVTIAIGCSLLVLNILIFAGVYYQRDKTRLEIKNLQQQRNYETGSVKHYHHSHRPSASVIVDVTREASNESLPSPSMVHPVATLPRHHHVMPTATPRVPSMTTLPRNMTLFKSNDLLASSPPNGSVTMHMSLPRPPPPPKCKSPPEMTPMVGNHVSPTTNTPPKSALKVPAAAMNEMRV
ncbi:neurexin protein binding [Homalodisca vitripennis]|nr:neurexin protein binding [Homalodisca vitripennis]